MREFPKTAVMERKMLTAENYRDCCFESPTHNREHSNVFVCVPPPVTFFVAIILLSFPLFCRLSLVANKKYFVLTAAFKSR